MQTVALSHHQQPHSGLQLSAAVKYVIAALLLIIAAFELSPAHLIMLSVASGLVLLVMNSMDKVNAINVNDRKQILGGAGFDGGSFHQLRSQPVKTGARSVIRDGGSFERASLQSSTKV